MAADVVSEPPSSNPCCAKLKERYLKLEEKRNALRKAVKIYEHETNKMMSENVRLKKAYEDEQLHGKQEKEAREKEISIRKELEEEIHNLKAALYQKNECSKNVNDDENQLLKAGVKECQEEIKRLKELLVKEREKADSEMKKAESVKKKDAEARKLLKIEKNKAEQARMLAETERKKAEDCRLCLEQLKFEANELREKLNAELSKADDARKKVEMEKQKTNREKWRADSEILQVKELKLLVEAERKKAIGEKSCADHLSQRLEEEKQRREELQKKIQELSSTAKGRCNSHIGDEMCNGGASSEDARLKLLKEQLKLAKKQLKHAKRTAKLEKAEKSFIRRELHLLKHNLMHIFCHFNMLDDHFTHHMKESAGLAKARKPSDLQGFKLHELLGSKEGNDKSSIDFGLTEACCTCNYTDQTQECVALPLSRGSCTRPTAGIISELESPVGGSIRIKSDSFAVCSNDTSFSDERSLGSKEKDSIPVTAVSKSERKNLKHRPNVLKMPSEMAKTDVSNSGDGAKKTDTSFGKRETENAYLISCGHDAVGVVDHMCHQCSKRRKLRDTINPVACHIKENQLDFKMGENHSAAKDGLKKGDGLSAGICSQSCGISRDLGNVIGLPNEVHDKLCRRNCNPGINVMATKQQMTGLETHGQNSNHKQFDKFYREESDVPCHTETAPFSRQVGEDVCTVFDSISTKQAELSCFEDMICGNYMKLLALDNDADEERYRNAVEMPLSPNLPNAEPPNFELPSLQLCEEDSHYLVEKYSSVPFHSFDVMNLEISSNNLILKPHNSSRDLPSRNDEDFHHPADKSGSDSMITLNSDANHHDMLHNVECLPSLIENNRSLDVKQAFHAKAGNVDKNNVSMVPFAMDIGHRQAKTPIHCLLDPNALPNRKACSDVLLEENDKTLFPVNSIGSPSGFRLHSHVLDVDGSRQSCPKEIDGFVGSISAAGDKQNKSFWLSQVTCSVSAGIQVEGEDTVPRSRVFPQNGSQILNPEIRKCVTGAKDLFCAGNAKQSDIHHSLGFIRKEEPAKQTCISTGSSIEDSSRGHVEVETEKTSLFCAVFSDNKDKNSMLRILRSGNTFACQNSMASQIDCIVMQVLKALAVETILLPEEKVSVFFSLLLCSISSRISSQGNCIKVGDLLPCLKSSAVEISRVISEGETKSLFEDICQLDLLVSLIENFLIERKVLTYIGSSYKTLCHNNPSGNFFQLDGEDMCVFSKDATMGQFVAGCAILASICVAADHTDVLLEASYRILRTCRYSISWNLLAMHVFAFVCGQKLFNLDKYCFLLTTIRSVVSLFEGGQDSGSSISSCLHSTTDVGASFPPCECCPFSLGAVDMDELINLLLDAVQDHDLNGVMHSDANECGAFPVSAVSERTMIAEESNTSRHESVGLTIGFHQSCCVYNEFGKSVADRCDCFSGRVCCQLIDLVSLVELVGCYMRWEWTYNKMIRRLLKIMESSKSEDFAAALLVLIGHLGRLGIDAGGYEQEGIAELGSALSSCLNTTIERKRSLPTQLAAVGALLNLLPLSFGVILDERQELMLDESQTCHAKQIKQWFSQLGKQQQSLSLDLLG